MQCVVVSVNLQKLLQKGGVIVLVEQHTDIRHKTFFF